MALSSKHPEFTERFADWLLMRDSYEGERAVKARGETYLPATSGMRLDGMKSGQKGYLNYQAYKQRAVFPDDVKEAVKAMIGVMHRAPAVIELPTALEPLRERATLHGESLQLLLRRINEAQLLTGRIGLLLDLPTSAPEPGAAAFYLATYEAETITNWDDGGREQLAPQALNLVVLDESEYERTDSFEWEYETKYRVLVLGAPDENEPTATYRQGEFLGTETDFSESELITPSVRGNTLNFIPFVFINASDLLPQPLCPPLLELANLSMAIYRGESDYRQSLHMQGQDTLVVKGGDKDIEYRTGAGAAICPPSDGDAGFIGVSADGLSEQRQAIENDRRRAGETGARLLNTASRERESGEALKVRVAAQTTTLNQVALTGAEGLQSILRMAARWLGANPEDVIVKPNLEFAARGLSPAEFMQLADGKARGLPISEESLHALLKEQGYTEKDFADEVILLNEERTRTLDNLMQ